jgi:hypothetical protein
MLTAFANELRKIAESNVAESSASWKGTNVATQSLLPKSPGIKPMSSIGAKPTNYSIVNTQSPTAAYGSAAATSKAAPPPPVRT